jgi:phenylalanyl-tRNA synthetase beta chain
MNILSEWLRSYLPALPVSDAQLAEDLTLRGIAVEGIFDLVPRFGAGAGSLFEMDITTNRVDAMNHYGIAREAATIYSLPLQPLETALPEPGSAATPFPVRIEDGAKHLCGRFTARVLRGITIKPSAGLVAERFRLLDQKLISNAVDATNYVTQAIGQPTHAFDLDKLSGGIVVRRARKGERLRTLDGVERALDPDDLVIADEEKALSLAGVMGGWDSMIMPETRNVLVEAAWFELTTVRRSSKRHGLHTDASHRFERGADFNAAPAASALVSKILLEAGGSIEGELVDILQPEAERRTARRPSISLALSEVHRILGPADAPEGITDTDVESILTGLGCSLAPAGAGNSTHTAAGGVQSTHGKAERGQGWTTPSMTPAAPGTQSGPAVASAHGAFASTQAVTLPSWRLDLEREIDLIEEIARVYGYNRFRNTLPAFSGTVRQLPHAAAERTVRSTLLACGLSEAVSSTFCSAADANTFAPQPNSAAALENPLSEEAGMMRPSLLPGMVGMLAHNLHRDVDNLALFELGTVFTGSGSGERTNERIDERPALSIGLAGALGEHAVDFYTLKGIVEQTAARYASKNTYYDRFPADSGLMPAYLHPGRSARLVIDGSTIGYFGQLHPAEAQRHKLKVPVYLGELRMDRLYAQGLRHPMPRELSRYQAVRRDFSFLLPDVTTYAQVEDALRGLALDDLQTFAPAELLRAGDSQQIPAGHFSLLLRTTFQSTDRTLRDEDLQTYSARIIGAVEGIGGRLRS